MSGARAAFPAVRGAAPGRGASPHGHPSRRIIAMMSPEDSWVSKWQRISEWLFPSGLGAGDPFSPASPSLGPHGGFCSPGGAGAGGEAAPSLRVTPCFFPQVTSSRVCTQCL